MGKVAFDFMRLSGRNGATELTVLVVCGQAVVDMQAGKRVATTT